MDIYVRNLTTCGLYYKPMMIVNNDSRVVNKLETSLTDDARVIIYNCPMFIVQATVLGLRFLISQRISGTIHSTSFSS
jgi:hypothetical protein